jgi:hypothetical protein
VDVDITLRTIGIEPNPVAKELSAYHISFIDFDIPEAQRPLEEVIVLMDGTVVVPLEKQVKLGALTA